jgi:hypothetical protein
MAEESGWHINKLLPISAPISHGHGDSTHMVEIGLLKAHLCEEAKELGKR